MDHTTPTPPNFERPDLGQSTKTFWQSQKILLKGFLIGFLVLMLLIPTFFISSLVQERANRSEQVKREISAQWGKEQEIRGPVIAIPYWEMQKGVNNKIRKIKSHALFLPNKLMVKGGLQPEIKHRSIFEMVVYTSNLNIVGSFENLNLDKLKIPRENFIMSDAQILFGLSDFKGINEEMNLTWNGQKVNLNAGVPDNNLIRKGLSAPINLSAEAISGKTDFSMKLQLRGSEGLFFLPLGKTTKVKLNSNWSNPSFEGNSPVSTIDDSSFTADWTLLSINREYPQEWRSSENYNVTESSFGVNLLQPVNHYSKNERSVKYGILIILLTFVVYFFIEILQKKNAHAIQYVLVGFALCIFYTLLLSFSELVGFNWAYLISAGATIILLGVYTKSVFQSIKSGLIFSAFLSGLYLFIFSLIQLQDQALLFGSIGLFIILALVMFVSRKINWYSK
jgi:inner membrane protein